MTVVQNNVVSKNMLWREFKRRSKGLVKEGGGDSSEQRMLIEGSAVRKRFTE